MSLFISLYCADIHVEKLHVHETRGKKIAAYNQGDIGHVNDQLHVLPEDTAEEVPRFKESHEGGGGIERSSQCLAHTLKLSAAFTFH